MQGGNGTRRVKANGTQDSQQTEYAPDTQGPGCTESNGLDMQDEETQSTLVQTQPEEKLSEDQVSWSLSFDAAVLYNVHHSD